MHFSRGGKRKEEPARRGEYAREGKERMLTSPRAPIFLSSLFFSSSSNYVVKREAIKTQEIEQQSHLRAAASLRCIDPRRWPGEGGKERKEPARRSSEAGREREGLYYLASARRSRTKRASTFCWNRSAAPKPRFS